MSKIHPNYLLFRSAALEKYNLEAAAILSMIPVERQGLGTMAVDKYYRCYYDPVFLERLESDQEYRDKIFTRCPDRTDLPVSMPAHGPDGAGSYLVTHEVDHLINNHAVRAQAIGVTTKEDGELMNIAWDIVIEWQKRKHYGYIATGGAHAEAFNVDGNQPGEAIYYTLKKRKENNEDIRTGDPLPDPPEPEQFPVNPGGSSDDCDQDGEPVDNPWESWENPQDDNDSDSGDTTPPPSSKQDDLIPSSEQDGGGCSPDTQDYDEQVPLTSGSCSDGLEKDWELPEPESCGTEGVSEHEHEHILQDIATNYVEEHKRDQGTGAGGRDIEWAKEMIRSKVDIASIVQRFVKTGVARSSGDGGRSWRRPKRYSPGQGIELPQRRKLIANIAVVVDTSGSMHCGTTMGQVLGALDRLIRGFQQRGKVLVMTGDTEISSVNHVVNTKEIEFTGGGGTDMGLLVESAADINPKPDAVVVITDGWTNWCEPIDIPVFAVLTESVQEHYKPPAWIKSIDISVEALTNG